MDPDPDMAAWAHKTGSCVEQPFVVSFDIARWIGVLLEAHYGSAQVKFTWHADPNGLPMLAIEDDPWDTDPQEQPRLLYPDEHGRYALTDCWTALTDEQATQWLGAHTAVLAELAATEPSPNVPATITDYLQLGQAHRDFDPEYPIRGIRQALANYADRRSADPIVDVVTDPGAESGIGVAVFVNGRPVSTHRRITLPTGTRADPDAVYDVIEQAEVQLTPPAAVLVRALLEPHLRPAAAGPSAPE
ncbi:hypothetical protein [Amycolatopsis magusensis]|uniref:hypothetical protein n=1 Tax=Amycolatopsis magusensis TaxID=882444 RepID=UPI0037BC295F